MTIRCLLLILLLTTPGCICRFSANTRLTITPPPELACPITLGLSDVAWIQRNNAIEIAGYGSHPKEHKTYCFFLSEPYPAFNPRWIHIEPKSPNTATLTLKLASNVLRPLNPNERTPRTYTAEIPTPPPPFAGTITIPLHHLKLTSPTAETITITGTLVATRASQEHFDHVLALAANAQ